MTTATTRLAIAAAAFALPAVPALAYDAPPSSSTPPSSGGSTTGSSGGSPTSIPEPAAIGLFALGIAGAAVIRRRRRKAD
jgi:hypothetical protein